MIEFKATNEWYKKAAELESGLEFTCSSGNVFQDLGLDNQEVKAKIASIPIQFKEGIRVLMLIDRGVQNSNKGSRRWINKIITHDPLSFNVAAAKLMELQDHIGDTNVRLYCSLNPRNLSKAIIHFKHKQLDLLSDNEVNFYSRINDSFCSSLMQPDCKAGKLFLIDCDSRDPKEVSAFLIQNNDIKQFYQYPTPNGWHYIVEPFNVQLCASAKTFEVKRDALMLLRWIE